MDDDLVIRHVRLCECGKRAGHDSICRPGRAPAGLDPDPEVQPVDPEVEKEFARRSEGRFERRRQTFDAERRERRATTDTFELHRHARERALVLSTVGGSAISRGAPNSESQRIGPGRQQQLDDDPRWREHWDVIRSRLGRVLDLLDEYEGHGTVAGTTQLLGVEKKKRVIRDGAGLSPLAVVEKLGRDITGSPRTVALDREEAGVCVRDGTHPHEGCRCKICRQHEPGI